MISPPFNDACLCVCRSISLFCLLAFALSIGGSFVKMFSQLVARVRWYLSHLGQGICTSYEKTIIMSSVISWRPASERLIAVPPSKWWTQPITLICLSSATTHANANIHDSRQYPPPTPMNTTKQPDIAHSGTARELNRSPMAINWLYIVSSDDNTTQHHNNRFVCVCVFACWELVGDARKGRKLRKWVH